MVGTDFTHLLPREFIQFLPRYLSNTYHLGDELSKCSLKYEPSLLTKQASLGWDNVSSIHRLVQIAINDGGSFRLAGFQIGGYVITRRGRGLKRVH